jgi:haloacetate dehalogenase
MSGRSGLRTATGVRTRILPRWSSTPWLIVDVMTPLLADGFSQVNWDDFAHATVQTDGAAISVNYGGTGPAVLLLHGFPETKLMWREIALRLAEQFFVVAADLRGYGASSTPPSTSDHMPYSKRAMANDMVQAMAHLGHDRFVVAGHDRGGRVAYRTALDHRQAVSRLAVLDVLPVDIVWFNGVESIH